MSPADRILFAAALIAGVSGCGRGADPGLQELGSRLLEATPPEQRPLLEKDLEALARLHREDRLGANERQALLDLFRSAARDGSLDDDERALLSSLTRDVVVGSGRLGADSLSPKGS